MFDVMFVRQKRNKTNLKRVTLTIYPLGSIGLNHATTKHRCEIQCEEFEISEEHKCLGDLN